LLKKALVDAMQGENRFESGAYTAVREHFEPIFNAAARRQRLFQQPVRMASDNECREVRLRLATARLKSPAAAGDSGPSCERGERQ
jgi:hypothetical protein